MFTAPELELDCLLVLGRHPRFGVGRRRDVGIVERVATIGGDCDGEEILQLEAMKEFLQWSWVCDSAYEKAK